MVGCWVRMGANHYNKTFMSQPNSSQPLAQPGDGDDNQPRLHRVLKQRHLSMIAIGGAIGTGLFVASGSAIAQIGPGGAVLTYLLIGIMVYYIMTSLGELAAFMPVAGSFSTYASRYVDRGFGFALGWNFWFSWAVVVAVDLVASQLVMAYWFPDVPGILWSGLFLLLMVGLNAFSARGFAEAEYWFALIKVLAVVAFLVTGVLILSGIIRNGHVPGFENWTTGDAPFVGNFATFVGVAMIVAYSFQGTELVGVAAGESENPRENVPRAIRQVFWRILLFYVLAILIIGLILPYNDPSLLKTGMEDVGASPFTLVFKRAGFALAAGMMNTVILTAILSAGNSGLYASTRMLYNMALNGMAPRWLGQLSSGGVPRRALIATTVVASLCFLTSLVDEKGVYLWLLNASGMTGFIAWLGIAVCHLRFRRAYLHQGGELHALPYRARWFPLGPLLAFGICMVVMLGQNYGAFSGEHIDWMGLSATYIGIPLFLVLWLGYKWRHRTRVVALHEVDLVTGRL